MWSLFFIAVAPVHAGDACTTKLLEEHIIGLEDAFTNQDLAKLAAKKKSIKKELSCLNESIPPDMAAKYHQMTGLLLWIDRKPDEAKRYFSASKHASPSMNLGTSIFPEGHTVHDLFTESPTPKYGPPLEPTKYGILRFDGVEVDSRPLGIPTIFQFSNSDKELKTVVLTPNAPLPSYPVRSPMPRALLVGASGSALLTVAFYVSAGLYMQKYNELTDDGLKISERDTLQSYYDTNRTLSFAAIGAGGVAVALGTAAYVIKW